LRSKAAPLSLLALLSSVAATPAAAQTTAPNNSGTIGPVIVTEPKRKQVRRVQTETDRPHVHARVAGRTRTSIAKPVPATAGDADQAAKTPLNSNVVATSASRLGLTVHDTPATVEIVDQQTMREQGYRTTSETAQGAVGIQGGDGPGAPGGFSMRGFTFGEVNVLYNGIWIGPQNITSRVMDTSNLDRVEFLKGPSSLMSGLDAIGGSVNYVNRQPTTGAIKNELDTSIDSLGTYRTHFGSGGSTAVQGLDYRVDIGQSKIASFIDGDYQDLTNFSSQLNYRLTDTLQGIRGS
jgi:iron complex outermembrane recepter protein